MIRDYLVERKNKLQEIIDINTNKYDHNQIAIEKNKRQIKELLNEVDEATNIFSVVAREDSGFKSKEITEIEGKIAIYQSENMELGKVIAEAKEEFEIVNNCLEELSSQEKDNFAEQIIPENECQKEYFEEKEISEDNFVKNEIIDKLKLCKTLVGVDPRRTAIELDNIIKKYE